MFRLPQRRDKFRLLLPDEFIPEEIEEKYTKILVDAHSFITKPIEFLNESIQKVEVLGFNSATIAQEQTRHGGPIRIPSRVEENYFQGGASEVVYRMPGSATQLIDHTLNIDFRHTLGYVNYFLLLESFYYQFSRDTENLHKNLDIDFNVDLLNDNDAIYSRIVLKKPVMDAMDMLQFDYSQPIHQSSTFRTIFKYSDFDYQFISCDNNTNFQTIEPFYNPIYNSKNQKEQEDKSYKNYPYETNYNEGKLNKDPKIHKDCGPQDNSKTFIDYDGTLINR